MQKYTKLSKNILNYAKKKSLIMQKYCKLCKIQQI